VRNFVDKYEFLNTCNYFDCGDYSSIGAWWLYQALAPQPVEIRTIDIKKTNKTHTVCIVGVDTYDFINNILIKNFRYGDELYKGQPLATIFKCEKSYKLSWHYEYTENDCLNKITVLMGEKQFL